MTTGQMISLIVIALLAAIIGSSTGLVLRHHRQKKQRLAERLQAMERAVAEREAAEKAAAERKIRRESAALAREAAERLAARRRAAEQSAAERIAAERQAVEQAIAEWAAAEQAEAERLRQCHADEERQKAEIDEERLRAVEEAIAEWIEAERDGNRFFIEKTDQSHHKIPEKTPQTRTEAIYQQVRSLAEKVDKELHELEFIKNRIEADVDFLPVEFRQTVEDWKAGKVLRRSTFDDLKIKFRYKAYSIEDGYELFYLYNEWLSQQRQKLHVFIRLLGSEVEPFESIQAAIERLENAEREKYLEMDVDVIFILRDIRTILEKIIGMETVLKDLEAVCRKRSEQIINPPWEARGTL